MKHTLLLITLSLFLASVSSEATTFRTYPEGCTLSYTDDGASRSAETWTGNLLQGQVQQDYKNRSHYTA